MKRILYWKWQRWCLFWGDMSWELKNGLLTAFSCSGYWIWKHCTIYLNNTYKFGMWLYFQMSHFFSVGTLKSLILSASKNWRKSSVKNIWELVWCICNFSANLKLLRNKTLKRRKLICKDDVTRFTQEGTMGRVLPVENYYLNALALGPSLIFGLDQFSPFS